MRPVPAQRNELTQTPSHPTRRGKVRVLYKYKNSYKNLYEYSYSRKWQRRKEHQTHLPQHTLVVVPLKRQEVQSTKPEHAPLHGRLRILAAGSPMDTGSKRERRSIVPDKVVRVRVTRVHRGRVELARHAVLYVQLRVRLAEINQRRTAKRQRVGSDDYMYSIQYLHRVFVCTSTVYIL